MKRFAIKEYGAANAVFEEIDAQPRELTEDHIRVSVEAFAINPYDISLRKGAMKEFRTIKFPYVLGNDGAGIVTESASADFEVGDRVILHAIGGTYGEEVVLPARKAARLPEGMSYAAAAGLVTTGITAYNLLHHLLTLKGTEVVMVEGASGGVGSLLVQLLKKKGNRVLTSASKRNQTLVEQLGADAFAAYDEIDPGDVFEQQADVVIDATKGSQGIEAGVKTMKEGGTYVALNNLPTEEQQIKAGTYLHFAPSKEYEDKEAFSFLLDMYDHEELMIEISQILPFALTSVIHAHEQVEGHPAAGKIIVAKKDLK